VGAFVGVAVGAFRATVLCLLRKRVSTYIEST
jgi:hypothetical protein